MRRPLLLARIALFVPDSFCGHQPTPAGEIGAFQTSLSLFKFSIFWAPRAEIHDISTKSRPGSPKYRKSEKRQTRLKRSDFARGCWLVARKRIRDKEGGAHLARRQSRSSRQRRRSHVRTAAQRADGGMNMRIGLLRCGESARSYIPREIRAP